MIQKEKKRISNAKSNLFSGIISIIAIIAAMVFFLNSGMDFPMWEKILMFVGSGVWFLFVSFSMYRSAKILSEKPPDIKEGVTDE